MNSRVRNLQGAGPAAAAPSHFHDDSALESLVAALRTQGAAAPLRAELESLRREGDPRLRAEGLLALGQRQEADGDLSFAFQIYSMVAGDASAPSLRDHAKARLAVLQGRGGAGDRAEFLGRHFVRQATDPALLGAMCLGGAVFQATRLAVMSRLASSPIASTFTRGFGARALSWGAGLALEIPAFTLVARGLQQGMGHDLDWSPGALGRDLLSAGIALFLLKGSGAAALSLSHRLGMTAPGTGAVARLAAAALPQAAALTGVLGAHALEARLGLRPHTDGSTALVESLATLLHLHVAGRLLQGVTGGPYERNLEGLRRSLEGGGQTRPPRFSASAQPVWRPALAAADPMRSDIFMMSSDRPVPMGGKGLAGETAPRSPIPVLARPAIFERLRSEFSRLEYEMYYAFNEQTGQAMWTEQSHRITQELLDHFHLFDRFLPNEADRHFLHDIRGELRRVRRMLSELREEEDLPLSSSEEVRKFIGALYRVPNKAINYLNSGAPEDLFGSLRNAQDAREWLFHDVYRSLRVNADALEYHSEETHPTLVRLNIDPADPARKLQVPRYTERDEYLSPYLEVPGEGRKVVLLGEVPMERIALSRRHFLEVVPADRGHYSRLAGETVQLGTLDRVRVVWPEWKIRMRDAEYLEGYDIASAEQLAGPEGQTLMQDLVLSRLRPGGVALLVSRDPAALRRMVQITAQNQWADVIFGSYRGHLPVEVSRPDQEAGNFVFLRKLPQM